MRTTPITFFYMITRVANILNTKSRFFYFRIEKSNILLKSQH